MKHLLTLFLILTGLTTLVAQTADKTLCRVHYIFTHVIDTNNRDQLKRENMLLVIGKNASLYTSYDKLNQSLNMAKMLNEQIKNQAGSNNMQFDLKGAGGTVNKTTLTPIDYYFFAKERKFITQERLFNSYLVEETAPEINWKIQKDTASFSGIACQKASASFKGRNWIAWYATELPFQSGPWKLNGLPGLIIEAYDDKNEVKFEFDGLENITQPTVGESATKINSVVEPAGSNVKVIGMDVYNAYLGAEISLPADGIKTSQKDLDKLKAARDKDPQGFMKAQVANSGINGSIQINSFSKNPATQPKKQINNPIELPEKK